MHPKKKVHAPVKLKLHPRNKHQARYDFRALTKSFPPLSPFVITNKYGDTSIDFFNAQAVQALNQALMKHYYHIDEWIVPEGYLSPPIPGRADYIHNLADLLRPSNKNYQRAPIPKGPKVKCLDIGTGASCIYPLLGATEYGWSFVGTDIDQESISSSQKILNSNPRLKDLVTLRFQKDPNRFFKGMIQEGEMFDATLCNPPFHASAKEAEAASLKKLKNLTKGKADKVKRNFGGQKNELWYPGGELVFVNQMILGSKDYASSVNWFTTLISKESNLKPIYETLRKAEALKVKTVPMGQGNKVSRLVAWRFGKRSSND